MTKSREAMDIQRPQRVVLPTFKVADQPEIPLTEIAHRRFDILDRYKGDDMLDRHDDRTITANVDDVLAALRRNLEEHKEIVAEAKAGYIEKCKAALLNAKKTLNKRLAAAKAGEDPDMNAIAFNVRAPEDHSKEFITAIKMMELHKASWESLPGGVEKNGPARFDLKAVDVQRFILNDWGWMEQFLATNAAYSGKAAMLYASSK